MRVGRRLGLDCGHFTPQETEEFDFEHKNSPYQYHTFAAPVVGEDRCYCDQCNDAKTIKRINVFLVERDIPDIV